MTDHYKLKSFFLTAKLHVKILSPESDTIFFHSVILIKLICII